VAILVQANSWTAKANLKCKRVDEVKLTPHNDSCSCFLGLLYLKIAVVEGKVGGVLVEEVRKNPFLEPVRTLVRAAVHEEVLASRMTVDIAVEQNVSALQRLPHHLLARVVLWLILA
jgi:hypothetical protein